MSDPTCWRCRGEDLPQGEGAMRLGLCHDHLVERIYELMGVAHE